MNLSATLYTLAAIGFFTLMINRPAIETPNKLPINLPAATTEAPKPTVTEPAMSDQLPTATTTANEPAKDSTTNAY